MTALQAARCDASWTSTIGRGGKFHAIFDAGDRGLRAMCGQNLVIDGSSVEPASGILDAEKCGAPGCRAAFKRDAERIARNGGSA